MIRHCQCLLCGRDYTANGQIKVRGLMRAHLKAIHPIAWREHERLIAWANNASRAVQEHWNDMVKGG